MTEMERTEETQKKPSKIKTVLTIIIAVVVASVLFVVYGIPMLYERQGDNLFLNKQYIQAAEAYVSAGNQEKQLECGVLLVEEQKNYSAALTVLENLESSKAVAYKNYANAMLSLASKDYQAAVDYFKACAYLLDVKKDVQNATFLLAEKCLHEGYLNKAKRLYSSFPEEYTQNGIVVADRIKLLNKNSKFLDLVGSWSATDTYFKVRADSTTSSYYYYWYSEDVNLGAVTVLCPYNEDGTFTVKGTATFPCYQNFSSNSSDLEIDLETFHFASEPKKSIPRQIGSNSTTKLTFNGKRFDLQYKFVNKYSNVYWHYTYTAKVSYGTRNTLADDR